MAALTMNEFRARFLQEVRQAEETLMGDGHISPLFVLMTGRAVIPLVPDFADQDSKAASLTAVRLLCIAEDPGMVMHRCESWLVMGDLSDGVTPGQSDGRIEVVIVILCGRIGRKLRKLSSVREIVRGPDGRATGLADIRLPGGPGVADLGGPMADVMPHNPPTAEHRLVARVGLERMGIVIPS